MTTLTYDVRGVEAKDFDTPVPVGVYRATISEIEKTKSKSSGSEMIAVTYEISRGEHKGRLAWDYITFQDSQKPKMRGFLEAVGLVKGKKERGKTSIEKLVGTELQVRLKHESDDEFGTRHKVASVLPLPEDDDDEDDDDLADEVEDDDEEEGDDDEEGTEEDLTAEDLEGMDRSELKALIKEEELGIRVTKSKTDDSLREAIAEEMELEEDEEDGDDEDEDEDEEGYDDMSVPGLKAELKERGLKVAGKKSVLVKRLEEDDASEDDDDDDGDDEPF